MNTHIRKTILLSSLVLFVLSSALAQEAPAAGGKATITVTAIGKKDTAPAAVSKDDVQYLLTFVGAKGKLVRVQVTTELPETEFSHSNNAVISPSK